MKKLFHFLGFHDWEWGKVIRETAITYGNLFYKIPKGVEITQDYQFKICKICGEVRKIVIED